MELGALICTPRKPLCEQCPVQRHCKAFDENLQEELPVREKAKKQPKIPYVALLITNGAEEYLIEQRPGTGLLANMWQFPMVPIAEIGFDHIEAWMLAEYGIRISLHKKHDKIKHVFSHLIWEMDVYTAHTEDPLEESDTIKFVHRDELSSYPFPVPHLKMREYIE